jgi:hypothetical protein
LFCCGIQRASLHKRLLSKARGVRSCILLHEAAF